MTSEERYLTAIKGGQPDRVPVLTWLNPLVPRWATGIGEEVDPSAAGYSKVLEACLQYADLVYDWYPTQGLFWMSACDLQMRSERIAPERVKTTIHTPKGELTRVVADGPRGGVEKHWVESAQDVERLLSIPYIPPRPPLKEFLQTRQRLRGESVGQVTLPDAVSGLLVIKPQLRSLWTITERDLLVEMMDVYFDRIMDLLDYLLENDIGPVYYFNGPELALPPLMSPGDFDEFVVEYDRQIVGKVHEFGKVTQLHCHGRVNDFLERFVEIGTDSLNPLEPPPLGNVVLAEAKRRVGGRVCLIGNIQYDDLARASADEVEVMVRESIREGGPGGGFMLSLCAAPYEVPLPPKIGENLIHYVRMGNRYGGYPLQL